ncbi:MAG: F0F1 ATP synthase subunit alpha, partial [bacterium]
AQYREMEAFAKFGSELDAATQAQLARGARMVEILKQDQYDPLSVEKQVVIIYVGVNGYIDDIPLELCLPFEQEFYSHLDERHPALLKSIAEAQEISEEVEAELKEAIAAFKGDFVVRHGLAAEEPEEAAEEEALAARGLEEEAAS